MVRAWTVLLMPLAGWGQTPAAQLNEALRAIEARGCEPALAELKRVVAGNPNLVRAQNALGVCETQLGHPERAATAFQTVVRLEPGLWQAWNNLGGNRLALGRPTEAAEAFQKAIRLKSDQSTVWLNLGLAFEASSQPEKAFDSLDRAHSLAPNDEQIRAAWIGSAGRLAEKAAEDIHQQQYERAAALLKKVSKPLQFSASWNNLMGYAEFKLKRADQARIHLEKALSLAPDNEDYLIDVGEFLANHGAHDQAAEFFRVGVARMPHSPRVRFGLAVARMLQNRRDEAIAILEELAQKHPELLPTYRALGECYEDSGNWAGLVELGRRYRQLDEANSLGWYMEGAGSLNLSIQSGSSPQPAVAMLERAAQSAPRSSKTRFVLAKAYLEEQSLDKAEAQLIEVLRLEPEHERAHFVLGRLYAKQGKQAQAQAEFLAHSRIKARNRDAEYRAMLSTQPHGSGRDANTQLPTPGLRDERRAGETTR